VTGTAGELGCGPVTPAASPLREGRAPRRRLPAIAPACLRHPARGSFWHLCARGL